MEQTATQVQSKFVEVHGAKMHYLEAGEGDPILFIHGVPTSAYLWRKVIPYVQDKARCIAVDLIGMGESAKPDLRYDVKDHTHYLAGFIEALGLEEVTLVMHAWGTVIGLNYARQHPEKIKAVAFLEGHVRPILDDKMVALPVREMLAVLNSPAGDEAITNTDYFFETVFPSVVMCKLSEKDMAMYRAPFKTPESRKPIVQYIHEVPIGEGMTDVVKMIQQYSEDFLQKTTIPKLMFYAVPGFNTTIATVQWARDNLKNLTQVDIEDALHYAQESHPDEIGEGLAQWLDTF